VVGIGLPAKLLLVGAAKLNMNAVNRMAIWIPHRAEDHRVGGKLVMGWLVTGRG
jgi:hypothetical protein